MTAAMASLEEVLDFCNKVRAAGGANPLDALMPAVPEDSDNCLIARNLNFSCQVRADEQPDDWMGAREWVMAVKDEEVRHRIAATLGLTLAPMAHVVHPPSNPEEVKLLCAGTISAGPAGGHFATTWWRVVEEVIVLPEEIGKVAAEFDYVWSSGPEEWLGSEFEPYIEEALKVEMLRDWEEADGDEDD